ncbi:hypothetical protein HPT27_01585 [Permianibacter sp. IMCC34836]|uniref:ATP-binding protein n=1 Tax=Permianibacter fluminis TaxID=2738515 RepID=UPI0015562F4D|nr:ATP-binding protein [Permianibacter fluminis]NQD35693.1 hypothetical protein [Permianibacter fluminis]
MNTLFLRLYLALFLSLVVSAIGLDYLYSLYRPDDEPNSALRALWQTHPRASIGSQQAGVTNTEEAGLWLLRDELHWPPESWRALEQQRTLTLTDGTGKTYFYGLDSSGEQVFVVPLPGNSEDRHWFWLLAYYGTLALVVFLWLQPLVRDIDKLRSSVQALDLPTTELSLPLRQRSALTPVATALRDLRRHTAGLMALQRDIANAVSHDIRTPLARIRFALAMLPVDADAKLTRGIQADLSEIEQLVDEMLQYAEFEHRLPVLNKRRIPLQPFVTELIARYQHHHSVQIELSIADTAELSFDAACLQRALQNLLDNALRYARNKIQVRWQTDADSRQLIVEDDGPGLPDNTDRDLSAEFSSDGDAAGYGLGLAIVKKICLWHGGQLLLERSSELGGARVVLRFNS